jgi:hypothetical protein
MINILFLHAGAEMYGADKVMLDLIRLLDKKKIQALCGASYRRDPGRGTKKGEY